MRIARTIPSTVRGVVTLSATALVIAVAGLGTAAAATVSQPSTVYVSASGTDSGTCATTSSACASITYALSQVASGGTIDISGTLKDNGTTADGDTQGDGITVASDVTIAATPGAASAAIDGEGTNWLFTVTGNADVTFDGVTLEDGDSSAAAVGGAVTNAGTGTVTFADSQLSDNQATGSDAGGAVNNSAGGTIAVLNSTFAGNDASDHGAAINNADNGTGTLTVSGSTFDDNGVVTSGHADGGAIANGCDGGAGTVTVSDSSFLGNDGWDGGAIANDDGGSAKDTLTVTDSSFTNNTSTWDGGAIDNGDNHDTGVATADISGSTFTNNTGGDAAGAIDNGDQRGEGTLSVSGSTFIGNHAVRWNGGAIDNADDNGSGTATVTASTFVNNEARNSNGGNGGAIANGDYGGTGTLVVTASTFSGNIAWYNGGSIDNGSYGGHGTLTVATSTFDGGLGYGANSNEISNAANSGNGTVAIAADLFGGSCANSGTSGDWTDDGYNAGVDGTCLSATPASTDVAATSVGADLGEPADNGGGTATQMPTAGNAAIGLMPSSATVKIAGSSVTVACPATADQRGPLATPASGTRCDAGAVQSWGRVVQTVAFTSAAPSGAKVGGTYTPTATGGGSRNPVTFVVGAATTNHACTIADGVVRFAAAGTCVVQALQAGNSDYAAGVATQKFTIASNGPTAAQVRTALTTLLAQVTGKPAVITALVKAGGIALTFTAPSAGVLHIEWHATVKKGKRHVSELIGGLTSSSRAATSLKVKLKLNAAGLTLLKAATKVTVAETATFTPTGESTITLTRTTVVKRGGK